ncbi:MAG: rhodanese-like domain-containing protein [Desulfobulbaceae bacterium]|nr:rhodanese-like domain-containing protein [Desulfobulbaceae bacterium]
MITRNKTVLLAALVAATFCTAGVSEAGKPTIAGGCKKCHTGKPDAIRGTLGTVSPDFNTLQVKVGTMVWIVKYDDKTEVVKGDKTAGADEIAKLPAKKEILVSFTGTEAKPLATEIAVKQPYKVPEHQKFTNAETVKLVAMGPEKGNYTLVDARPGEAYMGGHIPTAISLPYGKFADECTTVLPQDKDMLLVFYCGGPT